MDARAYFLMLYRDAHGDMPGTAQRILNEPTPEQMRNKPPGHNSIAWILWHIARAEDWAVNTMLRGHEQVLTRDNWNAKLRIARRDLGTGMTEDEVAELSARIDLEALRGYFDAVTAETRRFVETFDFDTLEDPLDVPSRLALAAEVSAPWSDVVRNLVERQTTNRWFLDVTMSGVYLHLSEASHVFQMISPERQFA
jgi:hypothetical protein